MYLNILTNAESSVMVSGNSMAHLYFKNKGGWMGAKNNKYGHLTDIVEELV